MRPLSIGDAPRRRPSRHPARSRRQRTLLAIAAACACACAAAEPPEGTLLSLLAVGDTGARPDDPGHYETQLAVAAAMQADDRAHAVDAVVLLGDNFYDDGLSAETLVPRVRANLVRPYCRFLALTAPRSREVSDACPLAQADRHPVPFFALLGNHDYGRPESPRLQREAVPELIANWRMAESRAARRSLGRGVSLVVFESGPTFDGAHADALRDALRGCSEWCIVAAHHPMAALGRGAERERYAHYRAALRSAIAASGARVQLMLAAHEHNLQLLGMDAPAPALHAIAGGGSGARSIRTENALRRIGVEAPGYARVDLVETAAGQRLVVSLIRVHRGPRHLLRSRSLVARTSVTREGELRDE